MSEHSSFNFRFSEKAIPPIPRDDADGITLPNPEGPKQGRTETIPEEKRRLFEETLRSLDATIPEGIITYAQMFSKLPPETQATIVEYYTKRDTIAKAITGGYNRILQNKKAGITGPPVLPMSKTLWRRGKPSLPLPPESDFKKRAASDNS